MSNSTHTAKATKVESTFRMACAIRANIKASPARVWSLLTDASGFARWNSTVTRIDGEIAEGGTLRVVVPTAPKRTFKLKVSAMDPGRSMIWSDGLAPMFKGVRTFVLSPSSDGGTEFSMHEEFAGLMLPLIKPSLPDFAPVFETYAADLRRAAEAQAR
jgi:uncharacterized protein YndB with AHSA1/START domain